MGRDLTSLYISASFAGLTQISGSILTDGTGSNINNLTITASHAAISDFAFAATSASFATTSLLATSASHAVSSDTAISASYATFATFASGSVDTNSLYTASVADATITFEKGDTTTFPITINNVSSSISSSYALTASYAENVPTIATGSFYVSSSVSDATITFTQGDGSTEAVVVNNVNNAISASYAVTATSASHALYADNAGSSATATSASHALYSDAAGSATTATSASHAVNADSAISAISAISSSYAVTASYAENAGAAFPYTGSATISGSLAVEGTLVSGLGNVSNVVANGGAAIATSGSNADGVLTAVIGGFNNDTGNTEYSVVAGGVNNNIADGQNWSFIGGGENNSVNAGVSAVVGGNSNSANGFKSGVFVGESNTASNSQAAVVGGQNGTASGEKSAVIGGSGGNTSRLRSVVLGGENNSINTGGQRQVIAGGINNVARANDVFIAGNTNTINTTANASAIVGGTQNVVTAAHTGSVVLGGYGLATTKSNQVVVPDLLISGSGGGITFADGTTQTTAATGGGGGGSNEVSITGSSLEVGQIPFTNLSPTAGNATSSLFIDSTANFSYDSANNVLTVDNIVVPDDIQIQGINGVAIDATGSVTISGSLVVTGSQYGLLVDNEEYKIFTSQSTNNTTPNIFIGAQDPSMNGLNTGLGINNVVIGSGEFTTDIKGIRDGAGDSNIVAGGWGGGINKGNYNAILGGGDNAIEISGSTVSNGATAYNVILAGRENFMDARTSYSAILAGRNNDIKPIGANGSYYGVAGGQNNTISGSDWATITGRGNTIYFGQYSSIIGGDANNITFGSNTSAYSAILGGISNTVTHVRSAVIGGTGLSTTKDNEVVVPHLTISGSVTAGVYAITPASATGSMDCSLGNFFTMTLDNGTDVRLEASNLTAGQTINLKLTQNASSAGTISFDTAVFKFEGGTPFTASTGTSEIDVMTFISFDGSTLQATGLKNFS